MNKPEEQKKVGLTAYLALVFAIVFFSGIFAKVGGWLGIFDFTVLNGSFGKIIGEGGKAFEFRGTGGFGAKDGFLFGFNLVPTVMFALAVVNVVEYLGALEAARQLLTPLLRPVLGIPGSAGLALIASLQSTDAGAGMTKLLYDNGEITNDERSIFAAFQFSAGGTITNYFATGAALFVLTNADGSAAVTVPLIIPLLIVFVFKVFGANLMRFYLKSTKKKQNNTQVQA
ncbi:MAG: hypothetical protein GX923_10845 [Clostridia bacterium]|jgi:nucleoside recognition membrane protein YjiH|nr:hypothetical protein [Clostridia bacterium]